MAYRQAMLAQPRGLEAARRQIARGERPVFHITASWDGAAVDVRVVELPIAHLFVPDSTGVVDGARVLVARTLDVDPGSFVIEAAR